MDTKKWIRRAKLVASGMFIGFVLIWLSIMIAGAMSDEPGSPILERVLKK